MILILRGHIRDSFNDDNILNLVKSLVDKYPDIKIFLHTWNVLSNNLSWRDIDNDETSITEYKILNYFKEYKKNIKHIIIDDDEKVKLIGNLDGSIGNSPAPLKGWKFYWYGKYKILDYIKTNKLAEKNELILNTRFDLFSNSNSFYKIPYILEYINFNINTIFKKNEFYMNIDTEFCGCDNIYIGNITSQYNLAEKFHFNMDDILITFPDIINQEFIVLHINNSMNLDKYEINIDDYDYFIVGCGLSGIVLADQITKKLNKKVLIIEKRDHIGGNCYDYKDSETGIRVSKYGAHIFHTNSEKVWNYVNKFDKWVRWEHKVLSNVDNKFVSIPVNITTINELCNLNLKNEEDVEKWLEENQEKYDEITNSEEMAKSRIGEILYEKMIKNYTYKQWEKYPEELKPEVLSRIPVRKNFDTRYFNDKYQALPKYGYTNFFEKILKNPLIDVKLDTCFFELKKNLDLTGMKIIYTGPIDSYFSSSGLEKLDYRSISFDTKVIKNTNFYQPNSVVNYPGLEVPYTRIVEYKHFLNQKSPHTIIVSETTQDYGEPFYPVPDDRNLKLYEKYKKMAEEEENILFLGRLANYKYFNMDQAILNSLECFENNKEFFS